MIALILKGCLVGFTLAFMIGPALFMLLQTSMQKGFGAGASFSLGVFLSDTIALFLIFQGLNNFLGSDPRENMWFNLIGGIVLIIFGTFTFLRKQNPDVRKDVASRVQMEQSSSYYIYILKGFFLNISNPGIWFIWITALVAVSANYTQNPEHVLIFFASILLTVLILDMGKAFIAHRLSAFLSPKVIPMINKIVGVILISIGAYLLINLFYDMEGMLQSHIDTLMELKNNLSPE